MAGRKNNHYHYAEKFDDKRRKNNVLFIPRRTTFVAALILLVFGIVSTTFAAYVSTDKPEEETDNHSIIVDVRTAKAERDIALTGANVDLAGTGYKASSGSIVYFDTTGWNTSTNSCVQIMIGRDTSGDKYSNTYDMTRVGSTNLYYYKFSGDWDNFNQICFIATPSHWGEYIGQSPADRKGSAACYTNTWGSSNLTNTKYCFQKASSSNNANISSTNNNDYNSLLNSTFYLYAATKKGSGSYESSTDGGNATQSGTTKNTTSESSTASYSTSTSSANPATNYPMMGSSVTLTNSKKTGYKFDDYVFDDINGSNTAGSPINMTYRGGQNTTVYARFSEVMHNVRIANNIDSTVDTSNTASVGISTTKTITAPAKTGYTFHHWTQPTGTTVTSGTVGSSTTQGSSSITFTYSSTATTAQNVTWTANYTINPPTNVSISDNSMSVGGSAVSLNPQYTVASGLTANVTYTIVNENNQTVGSSVASVNSNGSFTATVPGVYTVTISVTSTDGTRTSSAVTDTATVTVSPAKPTWTLTMNGYDDGTGTENDPYLVTLGSNFSFTAAISNPPSDNNYVYTWYNGDNQVLGTGRSLTFGAATASEATTANVEVEVYCVVSYTGATPTTTSDRLEKWYYIKSLIKSFEIPDMQKIYATPNDAKMDIIYNITNASQYDTSLYFSHNNLTFYQVDVAQGAFLGTVIGQNALNEDIYQYDPSAQMYPVGVKYFYLAMSKQGISAKTDVIHTTVGASDESASRAVYFINSSGLGIDSTTYRVMAFYIDGNGDLKYQTAQDVYKGITGKPQNIRFRALIPSDATKVSFAVAKRAKYDIPADDTDAPDYSADFFYAYTNYVTLDGDNNTLVASAYTNQGTEEDPLNLFTTTYLPYQSTN